MKILITNDDGIESPLIHTLYKKLLSLGHECIICAPDKNNSCVSSSLRFWEYKYNDITKICDNIYTHKGTPADGINYYLRHFGLNPDLIISGINNGYNAGFDVLYSGTIGAASEGIVHSIPSIALSANEDATSNTIDKALDIILAKVFSQKLYSNSFVYSFNIPSKLVSKNIAITSLNMKKDSKNFNSFEPSVSNLEIFQYDS